MLERRTYTSSAPHYARQEETPALKGFCNNRKARGALAVCWTILILVLCLMPTRGFGIRGNDARFLKIPHVDKLIHLTLFATFAFAWCGVSTARARFGAVTACGLFLAFGTEYLQGLPMIGRDCDVWDGCADMAGVCLGMACDVLPRLRLGPTT